MEPHHCSRVVCGQKGRTRVSGYYNEYSGDLDGNGRQEETGGGLRALLEEALGKINNLQGELATLKQAGQPSVDSLLESKGIDPAVAQIIPEGANPSEWLDKHGHLFVQKPENLDESGERPTPEEDGEPDPDLLAEQEAWEAVHGVSSGTSPKSKLDPKQQLADADTPEKLMALIEQAQKLESRD